MSAWPHPAYVIRTARLTARCYERSDVDAVHVGVLNNVEALRPYMPWIANEPLTREERTDLVRSFRGAFDAGENFIYGLFDNADGRFLGGAGLHPRISPGNLEIGYWVVEDRWGEGLAREAAGALTRVGFEIMLAERVEIRVAPDNARSRAIPERLGYKEEGTLRSVGPETDGSRYDLVVYGMLRHELEASPAAAVELTTEGFA